MLIHQGSMRNETLNLWLASVLACVAGALNAAAFYAVGFFSANMTGNVSTLSDHVAVGQPYSAIFYGLIVTAFIAGAACPTFLTGMWPDYPGIYAAIILAEGILMVPLGAADIWLSGAQRIWLVVLGLACLMGLQNATVTRISEARVRTTHVSGMATDIGVELGLLMGSVFRGRNSVSCINVPANLRLHLQTILSFLAGGIGGVFIYRHIGGVTFWIAGSVLAAIALISLIRLR